MSVIERLVEFFTWRQVMRRVVVDLKNDLVESNAVLRRDIRRLRKDIAMYDADGVATKADVCAEKVALLQSVVSSVEEQVDKLDDALASFVDTAGNNDKGLMSRINQLSLEFHEFRDRVENKWSALHCEVSAR